MDPVRQQLGTVDIPGIHIVIKGELHDVELFPELADLSGSAVVEHKEGKRQKERPHYHCWVPKDYATVKLWKERLRTYYDSRVSNLKWNTHANSYYTIKDHDSFDRWVQYVVKDPDVKVSSWVKWNLPGSPPQLYSLDDLVLPPPINEIIVNQLPEKDKSKREAAHLRFYAWLLKQSVDDELTIHQITEYWIEWTSGAYELRNVSAPIRYAWYMLQTDKKSAKERLVREIMRKNFENF